MAENKSYIAQTATFEDVFDSRDEALKFYHHLIEVQVNGTAAAGTLTINAKLPVQQGQTATSQDYKALGDNEIDLVNGPFLYAVSGNFKAFQYVIGGGFDGDSVDVHRVSREP